MKIIPDAVDYGDAHETFVSGICNITQIGPGTVRVSFYAVKEVDDVRLERKVVMHQIWDLTDWLKSLPIMRHGAEALKTQTMSESLAAPNNLN
jgi:hypothetical protein